MLNVPEHKTDRVGRQSNFIPSRHQNSDISPLPSVLVLNFFSWTWAFFVNYTEQFTMNCLAVRQRILN
jgi:hypothetical protein